VVFCRGFIYETRFAKGSDKSDTYNMGVFHQPPRWLYTTYRYSKDSLIASSEHKLDQISAFVNLVFGRVWHIY